MRTVERVWSLSGAGIEKYMPHTPTRGGSSECCACRRHPQKGIEKDLRPGYFDGLSKAAKYSIGFSNGKRHNLFGPLLGIRHGINSQLIGIAGRPYMHDVAIIERYAGTIQIVELYNSDKPGIGREERTELIAKVQQFIRDCEARKIDFFYRRICWGEASYDLCRDRTRKVLEKGCAAEALWKPGKEIGDGETFLASTNKSANNG